MRSTRCIVSLRYTPVGKASSIRRRVGGFLRYIQQRDHSQEKEHARGIDGFLRYAAYRDRTMPEGRLFDREGDVGTRQRRELGNYIVRSTRGLPQARDPEHDRRRACYRFVISPQDARGIDLRQLTRVAMAQLEQDLGEQLPPWVAAEHRNTAHPHVHVMLAARREREHERFQTMLITKPRLQRVKEAVGRELERQREPERRRESSLLRLLDNGRGRDPLDELSVTFSRAMQRLAAQYRREAEREAQRQLERDRDRGWDR